MIGVAISTTGDEHRLKFLETCVNAWADAHLGSYLFVTVDGDETAASRVYDLLGGRHTVLRVGQPNEVWYLRHPLGVREGRLGVATNKNTGIEILMQAGCDELFLSDDDTWPTTPHAVEMHSQSVLDHSMVCWGRHRITKVNDDYSEWSWPRGSMMYTRRGVVERVGGLDERFGPGGHEHVEWSRRIFQAGLTPAEFPSMPVYAIEMGLGARNYWNCEDMQKRGEPLGNARLRRRKLTSVRRWDGDWEHINKIMDELNNDTAFVPYTAAGNHRESATLWTNHNQPSAKEPGRT
jgi:hypothetical protein